MTPSPAAVAAIKTFVSTLTGGWSGNTDAQILTALNTANVDNPVPQGTVPNPIYESALIPLLNDATNGSLGKLLNWNNYAMLKADIDASNRAGMLLWAMKLPLIGVITSGESTNLTNYLSGTTADPSWVSQVSWAKINLGRDATPDDVAAARGGQ